MKTLFSLSLFSYDYRSNDAKAWEYFNPSTLMIDIFAALGLVYDRKTVSREVIDGAIRRTGVPAYFDPPRGLPFRIIFAIFDWIAGCAVALLPFYPGVIFKLATGRILWIV